MGRVWVSGAFFVPSIAAKLFNGSYCIHICHLAKAMQGTKILRRGQNTQDA